MKTIFVPNQSGHDYTAAEKFGQVVYLSRGSVNRYGTNRIYRDFAKVLQHSTPDDYLLVTGLSVMNSIAAAIMSYLHGKVNFLLFKQGDYLERTVVIKELLEGLNHDSEKS